MRTKHANLLISFVAFVLFSFSCFCISKLTHTYNQLINCRNHISEFRENVLHLKNKSETSNHQLMEALSKIKYEMSRAENLSKNLAQKEIIMSKNETVSKRFEDLRFFLPHLRKVRKIYPNVLISKGKTNVSFALGISTVSRRNHSYLKQTLTSVVSRMTPSEEKNSVVIVSIADRNKDYLDFVVNLIRKKFKKQVNSGSLEVISIPAHFYPDIIHTTQSTKESEKLKSWQIKQVLDFCILMLYAQPKARYYLQLEDDIIAKRMYFTEMAEFVHNMTSKKWVYIQFSVLGFIGKLFRTEDLSNFVQFFLMFYKEKPIDWLLYDILRIKICNPAENFRNCVQQKKEALVQYKPSLFQHVGIHSSLPGKEQYYKDIYY